MDLKQLGYLIAVAETGSMHLAAEQLHVSPQNVSRVLLQLEHELQTELFIRSAFGAKLTAEGQKVYQHALIIEKEVALIQRESKPQTPRPELNGELMFYFSNSINNTIEQYTIPFQKQYSAILQTTIEWSTKEILSLLKQACPTAFAFLQISMDNLMKEKCYLAQNYHCYLLISEPLKVVMSKNNPLASQSSISLKKLAELPFTVRTASRENLSNNIQTLLDMGIALDLKYYSNSDSSLYKIISSNRAYSLGTKSMYFGKEFALVPIKERIYMATCFLAPQAFDDPCMRAFWDFFLENRPSDTQKLF